MRLTFATLALFGLGGCVTLKEKIDLPEDWEFRAAMENHVDFDSSTGLTRASCYRIRNFHAEAGPDQTAVVRYQQVDDDGWKDQTATLRRDGDKWVWLNGDPPRCSIYSF